MEIHIGSDHAGFELKEALVDRLEKDGYEVVDYGAYEYDEDDDYVDYVAPVARAVSEATYDTQRDPAHRSVGIVIGGSGQGEAIVANRWPGVRAAVFNGQYEPLDGREVPDEIALSRQHNDANVLSLGARFLAVDEAVDAVERWIETPFSGEERHMRRLEKIAALDYAIRGIGSGEHEGHDHDDDDLIDHGDLR
jgi:ribose 5-phosphate isomerase B